MKYKNKANLLDNASYQPSIFRTKNWVEINNELKGSYGTGSDIKFKTIMLKCSLCDYVDACIIIKGTITITGARIDAAARQGDERNKGLVFKTCAPFTKCISRKKSTEIDNVQDIDIVMPVYNLIEYSDNYSKTFGSLWHYYRWTNS